MSSHATRSTLWATVAVAMVLVQAAVACGDADRRPEAPSAAMGVLPDRDRVITDDLPEGTDNRARIQETVDDAQDALLTLSSWGICNELTEKAERQISRNGGCAAAYDRILRSRDNLRTRRVRARVVAVDVTAGGSRAAALLEIPGRRFRVTVEKTNGEWKLPGLDLDDPTGLRAE
jgi:hypothetical protein